MVWKLKKSGDRNSVKNELPITQVLNSIRKPEPEKGTKNPLHLQLLLPKWLSKKIKQENKQ